MTSRLSSDLRLDELSFALILEMKDDDRAPSAVPNDARPLRHLLSYRLANHCTV